MQCCPVPQHSAHEVRDELQPGSWKKETWRILKIALPIAVCNLSVQAKVITDHIYVGHMGTEEHAAASLGNMVKK